MYNKEGIKEDYINLIQYLRAVDDTIPTHNKTDDHIYILNVVTPNLTYHATSSTQCYATRIAAILRFVERRIRYCSTKDKKYLQILEDMKTHCDLSLSENLLET